MPEWTFYPPHTKPAALDTVWCCFPFVENPQIPGPKSRPCLVRRVLQQKAHIFVEVSFGTSNAASYSDRDLYIANLADMVDAGLPQATIFQLNRTAILPWAEEWFVPRKGMKTPVIGQLNDRCREYLKQLTRTYRRRR